MLVNPIASGHCLADVASAVLSRKCCRLTWLKMHANILQCWRTSCNAGDLWVLDKSETDNMTLTILTRVLDHQKAKSFFEGKNALAILPSHIDPEHNTAPECACRRPVSSSTSASLSAPTSWHGLKGGGQQRRCGRSANAPSASFTLARLHHSTSDELRSSLLALWNHATSHEASCILHRGCMRQVTQWHALRRKS